MMPQKAKANTGHTARHTTPRPMPRTLLRAVSPITRHLRQNVREHYGKNGKEKE